MDHTDSWSNKVTTNRTRHWAIALQYLIPLVAAVPTLYFKPGLASLTPLLTGVSVFTALLFGLLGIIFNAGVTLRKDGDSFSSAHGLHRTVGDLRANITYAIAVGIVLVVVLTVAAAVSAPGKPAAWRWTPMIVWLAVHLVMTLVLVLTRFRTAFNYITR